MTRINVVPPRLLLDEHLLAEYRELPRVFALAKAPITERATQLGVDVTDVTDEKVIADDLR